MNFRSIFTQILNTIDIVIYSKDHLEHFIFHSDRIWYILIQFIAGLHICDCDQTFIETVIKHVN